VANFFTRIFNEDQRILKNVEKQVKPVEDLKEAMEALSDEELRAKTEEFKTRIANGETLDDILVEAFAVVREASKRVNGEFPYLVQMIGACVMHNGDIAEMRTGEGKTLTSTMAVYLNALSGKGAHVVTVNEYLAERDSEWMGRIYTFLGLTVGVNKRELNPFQKRKVYECDVTYTTNAELGFDYLRDNMVVRKEDRVLRALNFALVDEVDSVFIDEARTPLIISGGKKQTKNLYLQADRFVKGLKEEIVELENGEENIIEAGDFVIDVKGKNVSLTEAGVDKAEKTFKIDNLYNADHTQLVHHLNQALKANYIFTRDVEYVIEEDEVVIVDTFTGRKMPGRAYSDGLHQAIEAKEGVSIKQETSTLATITYQNFFRLYEKLAGMTGTAKTEEEEFLKIYNMRVIEIPTNRPIVRVDYPDSIYGTKKAKYEALINEVLACHEKGQPVLVGTVSVETSELLSKMMKSRKIRHEVLNAKNHLREAEIVQFAGQKGAVTIATNMAGRGTDIKLGEGVRELGGLAVIGSERHESRRIDNQLRGRSGRQGDPGYSRFFVSVQDDLMIRFGSERMAGLFAQLGEQAIESKTVTKSITQAQKRVEGVNFDIRKTLLDYDDVLRQQREIMYDQRNFVLDHEDVHSLVSDMYLRVAKNLVNLAIIDEDEGLNTDELFKSLSALNLENILSEEDLEDLDIEASANRVYEAMWKQYEDKIADFKEQIIKIEKTVVLKFIDRAWTDHIDTMSKLRDGIGLRSYAQSDPLQAYVQEGFEMFDDMMKSISNDIVNFCINVKIQVRDPEAEKKAQIAKEEEQKKINEKQALPEEAKYLTKQQRRAKKRDL